MSSQYYNFPLDIEASQSAYEAWRNVSFSERQQLLHRLAEILEKEKESHAHTITKEMHKPISQSIAEVVKCVSMIRYYAHIQNVLEVEKVPTEFSISEIHHEPLGVILGIMPWNFPYWQVFRFAVPTLLSGNGVILKHASICLESGNQIQKLFEKAGFPIHLFTHSELNYTQVEQLITHPIIKAVSLTGSEAAGRKIAAWAGQNLKKCVLELGGNDAFIVLKDADIEKAAKAAALGRLQNTGQTCVASKRYIVEEAIAEQFVDALISEYSQYTPQDVYQTSTHLGKMARPDLADELEAQYRKALDHGAKIILPLVRLDASSFEPGLLLMNEENPVAQEELFGPLGMLFVVPNAEKAVQLANNTPYGLGNVVFTQNTEKAKAVAQRLESGGVAVNQIFRSDERMPFGGVKNSGYGTELSPYALFEFTHRKTILGN